MSSSMTAGAAATVILTVLGVVHVYWAMGGSAGKAAAVPMRAGKPVFAPTPFTTIVVAFGLFAMAALNATKIGWIADFGISSRVRTGLWLTCAVLLLRAIGDFRYVGFFKRHREGRFAKLDTLLYSPLCLFLACMEFISANS